MMRDALPGLLFRRPRRKKKKTTAGVSSRTSMAPVRASGPVRTSGESTAGSSTAAATTRDDTPPVPTHTPTAPAVRSAGESET